MKTEKTIVSDPFGKTVLRTDIDISVLGPLDAEYLGAGEPVRLVSNPSTYAEHTEVIEAAEALAKHTGTIVILERMEVRA